MVCKYHRLCEHHSFEEHLDCFQLLVIMTTRAVNVCVYMDFCVCMVFVSLRQAPMSATAWWYSNYNV